MPLPKITSSLPTCPYCGVVEKQIPIGSSYINCPNCKHLFKTTPLIVTLYESETT